MTKELAQELFEKIKGKTTASAKVVMKEQRDGWIVIRSKQLHEFSNPRTEIVHIMQDKAIERGRIIAKINGNKVKKNI
jgi:hypothetical protein